MYQSRTRSIEVTVEPEFLPNESSPEEHRFVWAYQVRIANHGDETVRLRNRYWRITDAHGRVQEVRGAGVVGEQPLLRPGESFQYTSGAPLATPSGFMVGAYEMQTDDGEYFDIAVPAFSLDSPHSDSQVH